MLAMLGGRSEEIPLWSERNDYPKLSTDCTGGCWQIRYAAAAGQRNGAFL